ncbi:MAG: VanZ family protein [Candidatus Ancillula sp.]|nr:VanZ family protein [Candidatus Ancillula sp.]
MEIMFIIWPFLSIALTFPIVLAEYIRFNKMHIGRVIGDYLFVLYSVGVFFAFTLYPFPDNFSHYCSHHHITPNLNLFKFISDLQTGGMHGLFQLLFNIVFFIPMGIFLRNFFALKFRSSLVIIILSTCFIEITQLTAVFHLFPCMYRTFDVDDLLNNTLGGCLGFLLAKILPKYNTKKSYLTEPNRRPGIIQRLVILVADFILIEILSIFTMILIDLIFRKSNYLISGTIEMIFFILIEFAMPLCYKGYTPFGKLTSVTLDNKERTSIRRFIFLFIRVLIVGFTLINPLSDPIWGYLLMLILLVTYPIKKQPIYSLI